MSNLSSLIVQMPHHKIIVVGDLMLDRFIYGTVDRISPEAPIPVLRIQREVAALGGAGNVVRNLAAMGGNVELISVAGKDSAYDDMMQLFSELSRVTPHIIQDTTRPTTIKVRCIGGNQQMLRADREVSTPINAESQQAIVARVKSVLPECAALILSDYAKGVLTEAMLAEIISMAKAARKPVLIDPKGKDFSRYRGAFMLTPNRKELTEATGVTSIKTVAEAEQAARVLITAYNIDMVLAKLGADGVCLVVKDQPAIHIHGQAKEVFDVSGAGDTVVAAMALAIAAGAALPEAARIANLAGSIVVGKVGTATVSLADLQTGLEDRQTRSANNKIMNWQEALEQAEKWRLQNLKVGFTNGCFDLLHPGHISLLRQARAKCDRLILGLNTDASVQRLKGTTRPVQHENARAEVLAALADVDGVVLFDQDTPMELIKLLKPALLVKGADYTPDKVVGWQEVQSWGGELYLAEIIAGQSTSAMIARSKT